MYTEGGSWFQEYFGKIISGITKKGIKLLDFTQKLKKKKKKSG